MKFLFAALVALGLSGLCFASGTQIKRPKKNGWGDSQKKVRHGIQAVQAAKANPATADSIKHGQWLYEVYCNHCHGLTGQGDGPAAKHLKARPADLTILAKKFANQHFFLTIALGKGRMPTWGDVLEEKEMWSLTHYIQTLAPAK